jgi:hypothetical protein
VKYPVILTCLNQKELKNKENKEGMINILIRQNMVNSQIQIYENLEIYLDPIVIRIEEQLLLVLKEMYIDFSTALSID